MPSYTWDMNIFPSFSIWGEVCRSWEDLESLGIGQGGAVELSWDLQAPPHPTHTGLQGPREGKLCWILVGMFCWTWEKAWTWGSQKGLKDLQITGNLSNDRGFPHSSVVKESACKAGDPSLIPGLGRSAGEGIGYPLQYCWASLVAQLVKNPPAMWETWVQSLGWEDPLEKGKLPTPVFWAGEFHGLYNPWGLRVRHDCLTFIFK